MLVIAASAYGATDTINVGLTVTGAVCGNGTCESGETSGTCSLDCAAPTPPGGGGLLPDERAPEIANVKIIPTTTTAAVTFGTSEFARSIVSWGRTADYELGTLSGIFYILSHAVEIEGLIPATDYVLKIRVEDPYGNWSSLEGVRFRTLAAPDTTPPANVTDLTATPDADAILLDWRNPSDPDFVAVRIMRSTRFFPESPTDGELVFDGLATSFRDTDVAADTTYYYTVFARDAAGNYSSGAIVSAIIVTAVPVPGEPVPPPPPPFYEFPPAFEVHPEIEKLSLKDFDFFEDESSVAVRRDEIRVGGAKNLTAALSYSKVPALLKTIVVTVFDAADASKSFSFLLRIDKEKNAYEATVAPIKRAGEYPFLITILDYENRSLKKLYGKFVVAGAAPEGMRISWYSGVFRFPWPLIIALITIFLLAFFACYSRKTEKEFEEAPPSDDMSFKVQQ